MCLLALPLKFILSKLGAKQASIQINDFAYKLFKSVISKTQTLPRRNSVRSTDFLERVCGRKVSAWRGVGETPAGRHDRFTQERHFGPRVTHPKCAHWLSIKWGLFFMAKTRTKSKFSSPGSPSQLSGRSASRSPRDWLPSSTVLRGRAVTTAENGRNPNAEAPAQSPVMMCQDSGQERRWAAPPRSLPEARPRVPAHGTRQGPACARHGEKSPVSPGRRRSI